MATGWLIFIAIVMIVVVLFQVTRTLDLVGQLRGGERTTVEMTKLHSILGMIFMILGMIGFSGHSGIIRTGWLTITLRIMGEPFIECL